MYFEHDISSLPATLLVVLLLLALWTDVRDDLCRLIRGRNVVLCAIGAWYLLETITLPEAVRRFDQSQYNLGLFYVGLAMAGFLVGYEHTSGCAFFPALAEKITFFDDEKWLWRLVVIGAIIGFAPIIYFTGTQFEAAFEGMMGMRATWGGILGRGRYGDARAAFLMLEMFVGAVAPFAVILLFKRERSWVQRLFLILVIFWPALRAFGSGTRTALITTIGPVLAFAYWKASPAWRRKLILGGVACLPLFYALMAAIVISRGSGQFSFEDRERAEYVGNEMFRELLFVTAKVPDEVDYQLGYVYYVQLVNPIPRFLWPDKPTLDAGILMARLYGQADSSGEAYLTISPGLIGEMYLNFGVLGIIGLSFFGGWLVKGWDQIPQLFGYSLPTLMFYSGGLLVLFIMGRSFTLSMFYGLMSFAGLAWLIRHLNPHALDQPGAGAAHVFGHASRL